MALTSYGQPWVCNEHDGCLVIYDEVPGCGGCPLCYAEGKIKETEQLARESEQRHHFTCSDCGAHVKVDEDGCCATCGTDCAIEECHCQLLVKKDPDLVNKHGRPMWKIAGVWCEVCGGGVLEERNGKVCPTAGHCKLLQGHDGDYKP